MAELSDEFSEASILLFSQALDKVKGKSIYKVDTERHRRIVSNFEEIAKLISQKAGRKEMNQIVEDITQIVHVAPAGKHAMSKIWPAFHCYREGKMLQHWNSLSDVIGVELDSIAIQNISQEILMILLPKSTISAGNSGKTLVPRQFTIQEERAIMYAGGFVVKQMLQWVDRDFTGEVASQYYATLYGMLETGKWDSECKSDDFEHFIRNWMADIDRGGLKVLNESALDFFKDLETVVFNCIESNVKCNKACSAQEFSTKVLSNEDLLFSWSIIAVDIMHEKRSNALLERIVHLWSKIRGHSFASAITETYKMIVRQNTEKTKALRKNLQLHDHGEQM